MFNECVWYVHIHKINILLVCFPHHTSTTKHNFYYYYYFLFSLIQLHVINNISHHNTRYIRESHPLIHPIHSTKQNNNNNNNVSRTNRKTLNQNKCMLLYGEMCCMLICVLP